MNDLFDGKGYYYRHEELLKYERVRNSADSSPFDFSSFTRSASFTANGVNSMPMWAHYGANHAGFAVEYDMTKQENMKLSSTMFPVQYADKRLDVTPIVETQIKTVIDKVDHNLKIGQKITVSDDLTLIFMCSFLVFVKHESWSYEKEFRSTLSNVYDKTPAVPSAIYIGINCAEAHRAELVEIGKSIGASVFQMTFNEHSVDYTLVPKALS